MVALFLSFLFSSCTRPGDNALNKNEDAVQAPAIPDKTGPEVYTIEIDGMKFIPDSVNVHRGDTIVWVNKDMVVHCVTEEITKAWTSSNIPQNGSWKMVANNSSNYYCAIHQVMKGKIVVE